MEHRPWCLFTRHRYNHIVVRILETGILGPEAQQHIAHRTVTVLGYDDFGHPVQVVSFLVGINLVIFRTVDEAHHIGILLDGSRFTQVTQLRTFPVDTFTALHTTVQLAQRTIGIFSSLASPFNEREMVLTSS